MCEHGINQNVANYLLRPGEPAAPAIFFRDEVVTHGRLRERISHRIGEIRARHLPRQSRLGIFADNGPFFVEAYLATIAAGHIAVPFQTDTSRGQFADIAAVTEMASVFVSRPFARRVCPWAEEAEVFCESEAAGDASAAPSAGEDGISPEYEDVDPQRDLAAIVFTSGSTGTPKGVMVSHRNIECNTRDIVEYMGLSHRYRVMVVLPFSYCFGASLLHTHLAVGGAVVLNNRFLFPEKVLDEMAERRCTGFAGVPSTYQMLLRKSRFAERSLPALRWLQQAGGKLSQTYIGEIRRAHPRVQFFVMYGQTEATARLSYLPPNRLDEKQGAIGRGLPSTHLEVVAEDGSPVRGGSGHVGEIVAQGENITLGYWRDEAETGRFFRNGRLYTGDLAKVDEDGFIYLVDRAREFIKCYGYRVSPKEVEEVICELPQVVEAAVTGVPDELSGEAIIAVVSQLAATQLAAGGLAAGALTAGQIIDHCKSNLAPFKVPKRVEFLDALPKNASGKVDKKQIRQTVDARMRGQTEDRR